MLVKEPNATIEFPKSLYLYFGLYVSYFILLLFVEKKIYILTLSIVFLLMLVLYVAVKRRKIASTYQWKKAKGKLLGVDIIKSKCSVIECFCFNQGDYRIDISYEYVFNEKLYASNKYALCPVCNYHYSLKEAKDIVKHLRHNKEIDIFVNPQNPKESVVLQGISKNYNPSYLFVLLVYGSPFIFILYKVMT